MIGRTWAGALLALALPLLVIGDVAPTSAAPLGTASSTTPLTTPARATTVPAVCTNPARRGFVPLRANVADVGRRIPVLAMGRYRGGIPKPPPLTSLGKRSFAWDKYGPKPGSRRGNVRFNAHTYPDGSALGNRLLANLHVGERIVVRGESKAICYKVTRRISVLPRSYAARVAYYNTTGRPKLAIVVCSGKRIGPGNWTHRTIWFARPSTT